MLSVNSLIYIATATCVSPLMSYTSYLPYVTFWSFFFNSGRNYRFSQEISKQTTQCYRAFFSIPVDFNNHVSASFYLFSYFFTVFPRLEDFFTLSKWIFFVHFSNKVLIFFDFSPLIKISIFKLKKYYYI